MQECYNEIFKWEKESPKADKAEKKFILHLLQKSGDTEAYCYSRNENRSQDKGQEV